MVAVQAAATGWGPTHLDVLVVGAAPVVGHRGALPFPVLREQRGTTDTLKTTCRHGRRARRPAGGWGHTRCTRQPLWVSAPCLPDIALWEHLTLGPAHVAAKGGRLRVGGSAHARVSPITTLVI